MAPDAFPAINDGLPSGALRPEIQDGYSATQVLECQRLAGSADPVEALGKLRGADTRDFRHGDLGSSGPFIVAVASRY